METCSKCDGKGIIYERDGTAHTCLDCLKSGRLDSFHLKEEKKDIDSSVCPKCKGKRIIRDKDGTSHTCWDCLASGRLDNHSTNLPDTNIRF